MHRFEQLNYKCIALFLLFSALVFIAPVLFAQDGDVLTSSELSGNSFMRFKNLRMNFRNWDDPSQTNTVLGPDSVIQFPKGVTIYNQDGGINFNATIEHWVRKSNSDPAYHNHRPRYLTCPDGQEECPGIDTSEIYLPVKVVKASDSTYDTNGRNAYGFIALDYIKRNIARDRYQTVRTTLEDALKVTNTSDNGETVISGGSQSAGDEITSVAPPQRRVAPAPVVVHETRNCNDTTYKTSGYVTGNCLARKGMTLKQKAELVMSDVIEVGELRRAHIDPRFSACIAYRESQFSPNAKGGTPDWGMYQITNRTAQRSLQQHEPVTEGFARYRNHWTDYRNAMLTSTMAQADLHHSVLFAIAKNRSMGGRMNQNRLTESDYSRLALIYNGGRDTNQRPPAAARCYSRAIMNCFAKLKNVSSPNGSIHGSANLTSILESARRCN